MTAPSDIAVARSVLRARRRALWNGIARASWSKRFVYVLLTGFAGFYLYAYARVVAAMCSEVADPSSFLVRNFGFAFVFMAVYAVSFAFQWLARDDDLTMLVSLPVSRQALFAAKFLDIAFDLTRLYVLPSPLFVGAAVALRPTAGRWALYALSGAFSWALVTGLGMAIAMTLNRIAPRRRFVGLFRVASTFTILGVVASFMVVGKTAREDGWSGFAVAAPAPAFLHFLPTTWSYRVLSSSEPWLWFGGLVAACVVSLLLARAAFVAWFDVEQATSTDGHQNRRVRSRVSRRRSPLAALLVKEWRLLARNPVQLAALAGPVVVFAVFTRFIAPDSNRQVQVAFTGFFVAFTFGLQLVGAEGERIAFLRSVLPGMGRVVAAKAVFTLAVLLPLSFGLAVDWNAQSASGDDVVSAVFTAVGFAAFSVGMGAIAPRFRAKNPMRSARLPAILATYAFFAAAIAIVAWREAAHPSLPVAAAAIAALVAVGIAVLVVGARCLARRDIV